MEVETIEVHKYKTADGKTFDDKKEAIRHEREQILLDILTCEVMSDHERANTIRIICNIFDRMIKEFDTADVLDSED